MMKKVISCLLVILMCVALFASCGDSTTDYSKIAGKWAWKLDSNLMSDIANAATEGGTQEGTEEMLNMLFDSDIEATCNAYFTFNADGTGKVEMDDEVFKAFFEEFIDKFLDKLKNNKSLIVDIMNSQSGTNYTVKELEDNLATAGMSWEDLISSLDSVFDELTNSFTGDDSPMADLVENSDFKFNLTGDVLTVKGVKSGIFANDGKMKVSISEDTMTIDLSEKELPFQSIELKKVE